MISAWAFPPLPSSAGKGKKNKKKHHSSPHITSPFFLLLLLLAAYSACQGTHLSTFTWWEWIKAFDVGIMMCERCWRGGGGGEVRCLRPEPGGTSNWLAGLVSAFPSLSSPFYPCVYSSPPFHHCFLLSPLSLQSSLLISFPISLLTFALTDWLAY